MNLVYVKDECNSTRPASVIIRADDRMEYSLRLLAEESSVHGVLNTDVGGYLVGPITRTDLLE
jgi:hypothetical protein